MESSHHARPGSVWGGWGCVYGGYSCTAPGRLMEDRGFSTLHMCGVCGQRQITLKVFRLKNEAETEQRDQGEAR
uniref:Uncharacterized protein n=1 Tax=Knipowitschia caucasica TaxID=637954 RepID=A0AAV2MMP1_KNICA